MGDVIISGLEGNLNSLYVAIKEFSVEKIILISSENRKKLSEVKNQMKHFGISTETVKVDENSWEDIFNSILECSKKYENVILNCNFNHKIQSAAISAAFVNGLKAYIFKENEIFFLPIMNMKYSDTLSKQKIKILKIAYENETITEEELSKKAEMSLPLISYHVNGNPKTKGLKSLGLLEIVLKSGKIRLKLTQQGKLLSKIYR